MLSNLSASHAFVPLFTPQESADTEADVVRRDAAKWKAHAHKVSDDVAALREKSRVSD